jgi:PAS domain S-box-containing protein
MMMKNKSVILVVDDQLHNIQLLEGFLVREGYEIIQAESGEEALEILSGNHVDLVLLDVKMPRMSGFEVLTKLRVDKKTLRLPVVMITAHNEDEAKVKAFESGCDDFISKPFDQYELIARVKSLLRIKFLNDEVVEAREFAESIINTVREPLISLDQDLRVVTASRSFYEFFKVKPEETVGQLIYDLGNKQWDIPKLRELLETILPQHTTFDNYEVEHDFATIGRRIMLLNARQIQRALEKERIILLAIEDITEQKQAEKAREEALSLIENLNVTLAMRVEELADANRELETFNYTVSHDLRNPLNAISLNSQYLEMTCKNLGDEEKNKLHEITTSVWNMSNLIDTLMKFSRITQAEILRENIDFSEMARDVSAQLYKTLIGRKILFKIIDEVKVSGDKNLLRILLENLIGNAAKYTSKQDNSVIEFGMMRIEGEQVYFIRDNGIGFDNAYADKLFTAFQRLPGTEEFRGHGIGMATVARIIKFHGGRIWGEGEPGNGATFYFTVPAEE